MQKTHPDLECPKGLSRKGRAAYHVIMRILRQHDLLHTGGCKAFYSPKQWAARGEEYGTKSELVVVYDGGDVRELFEPEFGFSWRDEMWDKLKEQGLWYEPCTCWYSAIYVN
jgi:hypothetical protein